MGDLPDVRDLPPIYVWNISAAKESEMSTETNKKLVALLYHAIDSGDVAKVQGIYSADAKFTMSGVPGPMDFDAFMQAAGAFLTAFSQGRHVIKSQLAEGNTVSTRVEWHAVHTSPFNGIPASNKPVKINAIVHHSVSGGKINEHVAMVDVMTLMQQISAVPMAA
jgi:steroid delta-isomerase-like uncharacterized protein